MIKVHAPSSVVIQLTARARSASPNRDNALPIHNTKRGCSCPAGSGRFRVRCMRAS